MMLRAVVVLLLVLNVGIAAWWLLRPDTPARDAPVVLESPRLQLVGEVDTRAVRAATMVPQPPVVPAAAPAASATSPVAADTDLARVADADAARTPADPSLPDTSSSGVRCMSLGPFADGDGVAVARRALSGRGIGQAVERQATASARGWRVRIPPQPDRAAADAMLQRLATAGFDDYLLVPAGEEANGIALGRYRGERAARGREAALRAAGFEARTDPVGDASTQRWLDVAMPPGVDAAAAQRAAGASQAVERDCALAGRAVEAAR